MAFPAGVRRLALSSLSEWSNGWTRLASGGTLETIEGIDHYARVERGTSDNLQLMMKTLSLWARNLKPLDGFDERKASVVKTARRARHRPSVRANDALVAGLFPGHPAGQAVTPESLERVTEDQVKTWLRQNLRPERATLIVVSDREPDDRFWKEVEEWFGDLSAKGDPQPMFPLASSSSPRERKVVIVDQPSATQPRLRVGVALPPFRRGTRRRCPCSRRRWPPAWNGACASRAARPTRRRSAASIAGTRLPSWRPRRWRSRRSSRR